MQDRVFKLGQLEVIPVLFTFPEETAFPVRIGGVEAHIDPDDLTTLSPAIANVSAGQTVESDPRSFYLTIEATKQGAQHIIVNWSLAGHGTDLTATFLLAVLEPDGVTL